MSQHDDEGPPQRPDFRRGPSRLGSEDPSASERHLRGRGPDHRALRGSLFQPTHRPASHRRGRFHQPTGAAGSGGACGWADATRIGAGGMAEVSAGSERAGAAPRALAGVDSARGQSIEQVTARGIRKQQVAAARVQRQPFLNSALAVGTAIDAWKEEAANFEKTAAECSPVIPGRASPPTRSS